jgi:hypothetical protein
MDAQIRLAGGGEADLDALAEWLSAETDLRGHVSRAPAGVRPGQMGGLSDVLLVALGSGGAITALISAIPIWLKHRRTDLKVVVSDSAEGRQVTIDATNVHDAEALIREILHDNASS